MNKAKGARKPRKNNTRANAASHSSGSISLIDMVYTHFQELEQKQNRRLKRTEDALAAAEARLKILPEGVHTHRHRRNKLSRRIAFLHFQKEQLQRAKWLPQFFADVEDILNRVEAIEATRKTSRRSLIKKEEGHGEEEEGEEETEKLMPLDWAEQEAQDKELRDACLAFRVRHRKEEYITQPELDECKNPKCEREPLLLIPKEAKLLCRRCGGFTKQRISAHSNNQFGEDGTAEPHHHHSQNNSHHSQHVYERKKNFRAYVMQFWEHAKEIPQELLRDAQRAFQNIMVTSKSEIRCTFLKKWLRQSAKWKSFGDQAARIVNILNGRKVPRFTLAEIDEFVSMFEQTQLPFQHLKAASRASFLNSCFFMHKFVGIKGKKEYQDAFPLLRHKKTLARHESIWVLICIALDRGWEESL